VLLACTHYPLLREKIAACLPAGSQLISQGEIVADSLADYLQRHPEMEDRISKSGSSPRFYTTDSTEDFDNHAGIFYGKLLRSTHVLLS
jgi:glutamate racemase